MKEELKPLEIIKGIMFEWRELESSDHYDMLRDIEEVVNDHLNHRHEESVCPECGSNVKEIRYYLETYGNSTTCKVQCRNEWHTTEQGE